MPDIVLSTLNAKYIHAAFGLRYLMANLGELQSHATLLEFDINLRPLDIAEALLAQNPKIIGLGIYIWSVAPTTELVATLKRLRPEVKIILGGPEVSYETEQQRIVELADHVITGEADLKFAEVCRQLLNADNSVLPKIIPAPLPEFSQLALPYALYDEQDLAHRVVYVEASRGCPFTCEFCLSSLDIPVRAVALPVFLGEMQKLLDRGLKQFKFVDRTFNLNINTSKAILEFFLERHQPGNFYHFEMIPDRLPEALREVIAKFPPGTLQFEVGVQTFNPEVGKLISRKQDETRLAENFHFLRAQTGVHIHADLIAGLPGENVESFAAGFDRLVSLRPQEIQVGILKRLRGTPIVRHDAEWQMVYNPNPPYEILQTKLIDFSTMQRLRRFARYWDLIGNSGNLVEATPLIWRGVEPVAATPPTASLTPSEHSPVSAVAAAGTAARHSPFAEFMRLSDWLHARTRRTDSIALMRLMELLFEFLTRERRAAPKPVAEILWRDYQRGGRRDKPEFLKEFLENAEPLSVRKPGPTLKRQSRHSSKTSQPVACAPARNR
ncbi:MAG: DUF4080 domain-containing protein [Verrucomicrobia bacterium]|nr:MAG: DUF4080 domain-containing protein [Verrucomicrobiota bacterium]